MIFSPFIENIHKISRTFFHTKLHKTSQDRVGLVARPQLIGKSLARTDLNIRLQTLSQVLDLVGANNIRM